MEARQGRRDGAQDCLLGVAVAGRATAAASSIPPIHMLPGIARRVAALAAIEE